MVFPERHGSMTGIMKAQIDWIPLSIGSVRPTQGKTLAVMQVSGGSQSFNTVNQLRILADGCVASQSQINPLSRRHFNNLTMMDGCYHLLSIIVLWMSWKNWSNSPISRVIIPIFSWIGIAKEWKQRKNKGYALMIPPLNKTD